MMTIFKRIFASIIRKPFKSILLVLTIFVLGSFVGASYSIYQATQNVDASIKNNLDTYAVLRYNAAISGTSSESIDTQNELSYLFSVLNKKETVVDSNINPSTYSYLLDSNINHPNSFITNPFFINYVGLYGIDPYHNLLIGNSNDDLKNIILKSLKEEILPKKTITKRNIMFLLTN